jgi:hypothetical protein
MKIGEIVVSLVVIILTTLLVIVNQKFMFNPLLFQSTEVRYHNWSFYTYPSKIEHRISKINEQNDN